MENIFDKYKIKRYINAHDTITLYGGSRMAENTKDAMNQIAQHFVDLPALQRTLGEHIAKITNNEDAYIANCAAGAIQLCVAVCLARSDMYRYRCLPKLQDEVSEVLMFHGQHNDYDKALESTGATVKFVGDVNATLTDDFVRSITERTAAVFYFPTAATMASVLPLEEVVKIAHEKNVPVVVDAAAQLPPVDNLWQYTKKGADMVIFSGGKTLCGPQSSGLIVGKTKYIEDCRRFGAPVHGICRSSKVSREDMIGLTVAIDNYMKLNQESEKKKMSDRVDKMIAAMNSVHVYNAYRVENGSVGQDYPRAMAKIACSSSTQEIVNMMKVRNIFIGIQKNENAVYLSPQNLTDEECDIVCSNLIEIGKIIELKGDTCF